MSKKYMSCFFHIQNRKQQQQKNGKYQTPQNAF